METPLLTLQRHATLERCWMNSHAGETVKVLNNTSHPKAILYKIIKSLSEKQPENLKNRAKNPVIKHIEHFLTYFLNAGHNNPAAYQFPEC
jgi:hypothetical protein